MTPGVSVEQAFKDLVKLCGFEGADGDKLWTASDAALVDASPALVESLIKTAFGMASAGDPHLAKLQTKLGESGVTLNLEDARSIQLLCTGLLMHLISGASALAAHAAIAITTAACAAARKPVASINLVEQAEAAITRLSDAGRKRADLAPRAATASVAFAKIRPLIETVNGDTVDSAFKNAAAEINAALKKMNQDFSSVLSAAQRTIVIQDEELQHLWWLVGGRSIDEKRPFSELDPATKPLVLAKELAAATHLTPGPSAIRALFARAGVQEAPISIANAVNACDLDWLRSIDARDGASTLTCPLHTAVNRRAETGESEQWVAGWRGAIGLKRDHKVSGIELAVLFYRERLLRRAG